MQDVGQHMVVQLKVLAQFGGEALWVLQVLHAQSTACNFVFVGRANTTACGANLGSTGLFFGRFTGHVDGSVVRQDEWASFADAQA